MYIIYFFVLFSIIFENSFSFIFRDRDNLADGSERDSPWSCGGGSGGGRRPLTSIIEHLRTSKRRLHNGKLHIQYVYHGLPTHSFSLYCIISSKNLMKSFFASLIRLVYLRKECVSWHGEMRQNWFHLLKARNYFLERILESRVNARSRVHERAQVD